MTQHPQTGVNPAALIDQAQQLLSVVLNSYRKPDAYSNLARFSVEQASIDWGTVWGANDSRSKRSMRAPDTPLPVLLYAILNNSHAKSKPSKHSWPGLHPTPITQISNVPKFLACPRVKQPFAIQPNTCGMR